MAAMSAPEVVVPTVRSILCVRRGALGDTLLMLPVLRALRALHPHAVLRLAGVAEHAAVVHALGAVDAAVSTEALGLGRIGGDPAQLHPWLHSELVVGDHLELAQLRGTAQHVVVFDPRPCWEAMPMARQHLRMLGLADTDALHAPPCTHAPAPGAALWLAPGSGSRTKCAPRAAWLELAARAHGAGRPLVVLVGPVELERDDPRAWSWPVPVTFEVCPQPRELVQRLAAAWAFVGNDSGTSHLAVALAVPSVLWFGPTDPRVWAPVGAHVQVVDLRAGAEAVWQALPQP